MVAAPTRATTARPGWRRASRPDRRRRVLGYGLRCVLSHCAGPHVGRALTIASSVNRLVCVPARFTTYRLILPDTAAIIASVEPSGAHAGSNSSAELAEKGARPVPSGLIR